MEKKSAEEILLSKEVKYFDWLRMKGTTPNVYEAILNAMEDYAAQFKQSTEQVINVGLENYIENMPQPKEQLSKDAEVVLREFIGNYVDGLKKTVSTQRGSVLSGILKAMEAYKNKSTPINNKYMKQLEKKLKDLQKNGYEQVSIIQVLNWMYDIKRDNRAKR